MKLDEYILSKVRTEMHDRGMTNTHLAKKSGVSEATISRLLRGSNLNVALVDKILSALDFEVKIEK